MIDANEWIVFHHLYNDYSVANVDYAFLTNDQNIRRNMYIIYYFDYYNLCLIVETTRDWVVIVVEVILMDHNFRHIVCEI